MLRRLAYILLIILAGCTASRETAPPPKETRPQPAVRRSPEIVIKIASLDVSSRPVEPDKIARLASILRADTVDIVSLQGVTRYPDLVTRTDIVEELSSRAGMRAVFGETINLSGRQGGNAILSVFPIMSNENTHYSGMGGSDFEAALQAVIDCGIETLVMVSTRLPDRPTLADQSVAVNALSAFNNLYINHPIILSGNLPRSDALRAIASYNDARPVLPEYAPRIWYSKNGLKLLGVKSQNSDFGPLVEARFGIH